MAGITLPSNPGSVARGHVVHPSQLFVPTALSPFGRKAVVAAAHVEHDGAEPVAVRSTAALMHGQRLDTLTS